MTILPQRKIKTNSVKQLEELSAQHKFYFQIFGHGFDSEMEKASMQ